ncbi:MAG: hypothetical protein FJY92_03440 [Candidatus Hydrogenedentes bacterium]|nr:hypothetical protein [Candidatus Hydrogenedentota bacterium]
MRSRYRIADPDGLYFLTCTIVDWLPVFQSRPYFDIITHSLAFCRANKGMRVYAYVIMENHLHLVAGAPDLSGVMRAFKGFTAREIVALAEATGRTGFLILVTKFPFGNALLKSSALTYTVAHALPLQNRRS